MMLSLIRPRADKLAQFVQSEASAELTYSEVGASAAKLPDGYATDHVRIRLGSGEDTFHHARSALLRWMHFQTGWTEIYPPDVPVRTAQTVAVLARTFGVWTVHSCRVTDVFTQSGRSGFSFGTLAGHGETGEECFCVEHAADGSVWYEVSAFFRPHDWRVRLLWPLLHDSMNRFRRDSAQAMRREVE